MMTAISPVEALRLLLSTQTAQTSQPTPASLCAIDVRSEGEFEQGHLPGFVNLPILNNSERHEVGLAYKKSGQDEAIRLAHALVAPYREERIQNWCNAWSRTDSSMTSPQPALLACWRGGLRSKTAAEWMTAAGMNVLRVEGGYKAMRAELLPLFENPGPLWVLSGMTGAGKTKLLKALDSPLVIDLEGIAKHRGSSFGRYYDNPQPRQATFENHVALRLFNESHDHLLEDESARIGTVCLPTVFKQRMIEAPLIFLEASVEERSDWIFEEYVSLPLRQGIERARVFATLMTSTRNLARRLGNARTEEICGKLEQVFSNSHSDADPLAHRDWIQPLLTDYYDKLYQYSIGKTERKIAFHGNWEECRQWISAKFRTSA